MQHRAPATHHVLLALAGLWLLGRAPGALAQGQVAAPIPWQEAGPTARLFLQLPLEAPEPLPGGAVAAELRLTSANSLVVAEGDRARVNIDLESALTTLTVRSGVAPGLEASLVLAVMEDGGGFLDGLIEGVERTFRSQNFQRLGRPRGQAVYELGPATGGGLARAHAARGLGDTTLGLKWLVRDGGAGGPALALRAAVKAPTGDPTFGSGTWDAGGGLVAAWRWPAAALRLSLDAVLPGGRLRAAGLDTGPAGAAQAGLAVRWRPWLTSHLQLSAHLSPMRTGVPQLDQPVYDAALGASVSLTPRLELLVAGVENFASPRRGADAALVVSLRFAQAGGAAQQPGGGSPSPSFAAAPSRGR